MHTLCTHAYKHINNNERKRSHEFKNPRSKGVAGRKGGERVTKRSATWNKMPLVTVI